MSALKKSAGKSAEVVSLHEVVTTPAIVVESTTSLVPGKRISATTYDEVLKKEKLFAEQAARNHRVIREKILLVLPPGLGLALFVMVWSILAAHRPDLPGPVATYESAKEVFASPFYNKGPNDQGIGWNVLHSLGRVAMGFGMAAVVGIPLGFIIGRFRFIDGMFAPIIGLLRPVSPLAWLPIGLLVFQKADPAAIWVIFISSIWPMILNTAAGVRQVPEDYLNVARVLKLSEWKVLTTILFPAALPHVMTGVRLSIGVAWLVIVAAEMLTGGVGLGFWVWDEWNNLNVAHIIIAIFVVGIIGWTLEQLLMLLARRFQYE